MYYSSKKGVKHVLENLAHTIAIVSTVHTVLAIV